MIGVTATLGLLALYGIVMTGFSGWQATVAQFQQLWWLMLPLVGSFGIQVHLFMKLRKRQTQQMDASVAASGVSASAGMLACCAHHATDVLPFLGMSAASIFLTRYQIPILVISLGMNVAGVFFMIRRLQKHSFASI